MKIHLDRVKTRKCL